MTDIYFAKKDVHFTKTEKKLIDYIIASPQDFVRMSIGDVAPHWEVNLPPHLKDSFTGSSTASKRRWNFWSLISSLRQRI